MTDKNPDRPVTVELASGARYGLPSIAEAKRIYPAGKIVGYQDGTMIDPELLGKADLTPAGEVKITSKTSREDLEKIATDLGIEGADNKLAFKDKPALIEEIERVRAEADPTPLEFKPDFENMHREDLDRIATDWYQIDPEGVEDDALRSTLSQAYDDAHANGESESE